MAFVSTESHQNALDLLVKAAAYSADCPNGFLVGGAEANWSLLASYGGEPPLPFDTSTEQWLKSSLTNNQPIIINDALGQSLPVYFHQLRSLGHKFVVGVAIGNEEEEMKGVVFVSSPLPQQRLSTAQFYALQTHAALIGQTLQFQAGLFIPKQKNVHGTPSLARVSSGECERRDPDYRGRAH